MPEEAAQLLRSLRICGKGTLSLEVIAVPAAMLRPGGMLNARCKFVLGLCA